MQQSMEGIQRVQSPPGQNLYKPESCFSPRVLLVLLIAALVLRRMLISAVAAIIPFPAAFMISCLFDCSPRYFCASFLA